MSHAERTHCRPAPHARSEAGVAAAWALVWDSGLARGPESGLGSGRAQAEVSASALVLAGASVSVLAEAPALAKVSERVPVGA